MIIQSLGQKPVLHLERQKCFPPQITATIHMGDKQSRSEHMKQCDHRKYSGTLGQHTQETATKFKHADMEQLWTRCNTHGILHVNTCAHTPAHWPLSCLQKQNFLLGSGSQVRVRVLVCVCVTPWQPLRKHQSIRAERDTKGKATLKSKMKIMKYIERT